VSPHGATARQEDALRELAHLGSARAASTLAKLVGDVGVLVDVPTVMETQKWHLTWLFGGRDVNVVAASFAIEGEVRGQLWWVLKREQAVRLTERLSLRPGVESTSMNAALAEAANIVASACVSAVSTLVHAHLLPSTPEMHETTAATLVGPDDQSEAVTVLSAPFVSTNSPIFSGWLVILLDGWAREEVLRRLGM
jgi:chemotaxis protein CheC